MWRLLACVMMVGWCENAAAQTPLPVLYHCFDETADGWRPTGPGASVSISTQTSWNGSGALRFDYAVAKRKLSALMLQTPTRVLESAKAFRFWVN